MKKANWKEPWIQPFNFCPHCGMKLEPVLVEKDGEFVWEAPTLCPDAQAAQPGSTPEGQPQ